MDAHIFVHMGLKRVSIQRRLARIAAIGTIQYSKGTLIYNVALGIFSIDLHSTSITTSHLHIGTQGEMFLVNK